MNMMFGFSDKLLRTLPADVSTREFILFLSIPILMYWLGIAWQAFVF
jgi:hypothetical protein